MAKFKVDVNKLDEVQGRDDSVAEASLERDGQDLKSEYVLSSESEQASEKVEAGSEEVVETDELTEPEESSEPEENFDESLNEEEKKEVARRKKQREDEHNFIASLPGVSEVLLVKNENYDEDVPRDGFESDALTGHEENKDAEFSREEIRSDTLKDADYSKVKIVIPKDVDKEVIKERIKKFLAEQEKRNEEESSEPVASEKINQDRAGKKQESNKDSELAYLGENLVLNLLDSDSDKTKYQSLSAEKNEELIETLLREDKLERQHAEEKEQIPSENNSVVVARDEKLADDRGTQVRAGTASDERNLGETNPEDLSLKGKKALPEQSLESKSKQWRTKALGEELKNRPWTLFYDPLLKSTYEYKDESAYIMLERALSKYPDDIALVDSFAKKTNQQLLNDIYLAASALRDLGIGPGKVVTLCLSNSIQFVTVFYAIQRLQAVAHVVHPLTPAKRLVKSMRSANSYVLFTSDTAYKEQIDELRMIPLHYVIVSSIYDNFDEKVKNTFRLLQMAIPKPSFSWRKLKDSHQKFASLISSGGNFSLNKRIEENREELNEDINLISQFIESYPSKEYKNSLDPMHSAVNSMTWKQFISLRSASALPRLRKNDEHIADKPAVYLNSGGTMDEPKTIVLTSRNINTIAVQAPGIFGRQNMRGLKVMALLPFFHSYGLCMELHAALTNNMTCVLMPKYSARNYARLLIKEQADILIGVPTFYEALQNNPYLKGQNLSFIKAAFCGGDHLKSVLKKEVDEYFLEHHAMISLREGYGLSEASSLAAITPAFGNRLRSVGLPIADLDVLIADPQTGEIIENSEVGEILLSGPSVSPGYLNDDEMNKQAYTTKDGKRFLKTGDLGFFDEDGFLYYVSRKKRIIKVSGISVYPFEVEQTIREVDGVEDVICVAGPDKYKMSIVKAYVIPSGLKDKIVTLKKIDHPSVLEVEKNEVVEETNEVESPKELQEEGEKSSAELFSTPTTPSEDYDEDEIMEEFELLSNMIREHCKENLIKHAVPEQIIYVEAFPYTALGKVDIAKLDKSFGQTKAEQEGSK